jgi:hypothetical protein
MFSLQPNTELESMNILYAPETKNAFSVVKVSSLIKETYLTMLFRLFICFFVFGLLTTRSFFPFQCWGLNSGPTP